MPSYLVTNPATGSRLKITGDTLPTEQELDEIFRQATPAPEPTPPSIEQIRERAKKQRAEFDVTPVETVRGTGRTPSIYEQMQAGYAQLPQKEITPKIQRDLTLQKQEADFYKKVEEGKKTMPSFTESKDHAIKEIQSGYGGILEFLDSGDMKAASAVIDRKEPIQDTYKRIWDKHYGEPKSTSFLVNLVAISGKELPADSMALLTNPEEIAKFYLFGKGIGAIQSLLTKSAMRLAVSPNSTSRNIGQFIFRDITKRFKLDPALKSQFEAISKTKNPAETLKAFLQDNKFRSAVGEMITGEKTKVAHDALQKLKNIDINRYKQVTKILKNKKISVMQKEQILSKTIIEMKQIKSMAGDTKIIIDNLSKGLEGKGTVIVNAPKQTKQLINLLKSEGLTSRTYSMLKGLNDTGGLKLKGINAYNSAIKQVVAYIEQVKTSKIPEAVVRPSFLSLKDAQYYAGHPEQLANLRNFIDTGINTTNLGTIVRFSNIMFEPTKPPPEVAPVVPGAPEAPITEPKPPEPAKAPVSAPVAPTGKITEIAAVRAEAKKKGWNVQIFDGDKKDAVARGIEIQKAGEKVSVKASQETEGRYYIITTAKKITKAPVEAPPAKAVKPAEPGIYKEKITTLEDVKDRQKRINTRMFTRLKRLADYIVNSKYIPTGVEQADMRQEAYVAIVQASNNYRDSKARKIGVPFSKYAAKYIRGAIADFYVKEKSLIGIPREDAYLLQKINKFETQHYMSKGFIPSVEGVAQKFNISVEKVEKLKARRFQKIEKAAGQAVEDEEDITAADIIDIVETLPEDKVDRERDRKESSAKVDELLSHLTQREKQIVEMRYGPKSGAVMSFKEIGKELGIAGQTANKALQDAQKKMLKADTLNLAPKIRYTSEAESAISTEQTLLFEKAAGHIIYEEIDRAYGSVEKARDALADQIQSVKDIEGISAKRAEEVGEALHTGKFNSIKGLVIKTVKEAAAIAKIIRNPGIENHIFILADENGVIVDAVWQSSYLPRSIRLKKNIENIWSAEEIKDGYTVYDIHNHPSEDTRPSYYDETAMNKVRIEVKKLNPKAKGIGIIVNSKTIHHQLPSGKWAQKDISDLKFTEWGNDFIKITSYSDVVQIAKTLITDNPARKENSAIVLFGAEGKVFSASYMSMSQARDANFLRVHAAKYGASNIIVVESEKQFEARPKNSMPAEYHNNIVVTGKDGQIKDIYRDIDLLAKKYTQAESPDYSEVRKLAEREHDMFDAIDKTGNRNTIIPEQRDIDALAKKDMAAAKELLLSEGEARRSIFDQIPKINFNFRAFGKKTLKESGEYKALPIEIKRKFFGDLGAGGVSLDKAAQLLKMDDSELWAIIESYTSPKVAMPHETSPEWIRHWIEQTDEGQKYYAEYKRGGLSLDKLSNIIKEKKEALSDILFRTDDITQPSAKEKQFTLTPKVNIADKFKKEFLPFNYQGMKAQMMPFILNALGLNEDIDKVINKKKLPARLTALAGQIDEIYDVFGGSGFTSVLMNKLFPDKTIHLNDKDVKMFDVWNEIANNTDKVFEAVKAFAQYIHQIETPAKWWKEIKSKFGENFSDNQIWAAYTILRMNQDRSVDKISLKRLREIMDAIKPYARMLNKVERTNLDADIIFDTLLALPPEKAKRTWAILDPPYLWTTGYSEGKTFKNADQMIDYLKKLRKLHRKGVKFIYFNSEPISVFHRVMSTNLTVRSKELNDINEQLSLLAGEGVSVFRQVEPLRAAGDRREILVHNIPGTAKNIEQAKELPYKNLNDFIKEEQFGFAELRAAYAKALPEVELPITNNQRRRVFGIISRLTALKAKGAKGVTSQMRTIFKLFTGKTRLTDMTEADGKKLLDGLMAWRQNYKKVRSLLNEMRFSDESSRERTIRESELRDHIYFYTGKNRLEELFPDEMEVLLTGLEGYQGMDDLSAFGNLMTTGEIMHEAVRKNEDMFPAWLTYKALGEKLKEIHQTKVERLVKFKAIYKGITAADKEKIYRFLARIKTGKKAKELHKKLQQTMIDTGEITPRLLKAIQDTRLEFDELFELADMTEERYWGDYLPKMREIGDYLLAHPGEVPHHIINNLPTELKPFFENSRTMNMANELAIYSSLEKDPVLLYERYLSSLLRKTYLWPKINAFLRTINVLPKRFQGILRMVIYDLSGYNVDPYPLLVLSPEESAFMQDMLVATRDLIYGYGLGAVESAVKNITQKFHTMAEWGIFYRKARVLITNSARRQQCRDANIKSLGMPVIGKQTARRAFFRKISDVGRAATILFRGVDTSSRYEAYICGILAAEEYVPLFEAGKITAEELFKKLNFSLRGEGYKTLARKIINNDRLVYTEHYLEATLPLAVRRKVEKFIKDGENIKAKVLYLGHLAGYSSQEMTQYPYYKIETEAFYRGSIFKQALGIFGTWGPRWANMVKNWSRSGNEGIKVIARYTALWVTATALLSTVGVQVWRWFGLFSLLGIGGGGGTFWAIIKRIKDIIVNAIRLASEKAAGLGDKARARFFRRELKRALSEDFPIPGGRQWNSIKEAIDTPNLSVAETVSLMFIRGISPESLRDKARDYKIYRRWRKTTHKPVSFSEWRYDKQERQYERKLKEAGF